MVYLALPPQPQQEGGTAWRPRWALALLATCGVVLFAAQTRSGGVPWSHFRRQESAKKAVQSKAVHSLFGGGYVARLKGQYGNGASIDENGSDPGAGLANITCDWGQHRRWLLL